MILKKTKPKNFLQSVTILAINMKMLYILSILVIVGMCVQGISGENSDQRSIDFGKHLLNFKNLFLNALQTMATQLRKKGSDFFKELSAPRTKSARDISVWKICSRPLKYKAQPQQKKETSIKFNQSIVRKSFGRFKFYV